MPDGYGVFATRQFGGDNPMPPLVRSGDEPPTWSPDGRRLLWWPPTGGGLTSVRVTEAGTDRTTVLPLTGLDGLAGPVTRVRWRPGGGLVLLGPDRLLGWTDAAGVVTGRPAATVLAGELRLSPDERYGIADDRRVVALDTGTTVWPVPTGATAVAWADAGHVVTVAGSRIAVVEVATGRTVRSVVVPGERTWVLPFRGDPPPGAIVV